MTRWPLHLLLRHLCGDRPRCRRLPPFRWVGDGRHHRVSEQVLEKLQGQKSTLPTTAARFAASAAWSATIDRKLAWAMPQPRPSVVGLARRENSPCFLRRSSVGKYSCAKRLPGGGGSGMLRKASPKSLPGTPTPIHRNPWNPQHDRG